jgi:hypothetical protein
MNHAKTLITLTVLSCATSRVMAQFETTGYDIKPESVSGNQIFTGAHDDNSGVETLNVQTYGYYFSNSDDPYFDQDPGINAASGSGLQNVGAAPGFAGPIISFNILSAVTYWDGTGPVTQKLMPASQTMVYNLGTNYRTLDSTSGPQAGFNIGTVNLSNGTFHRHLNDYLFGNHADPSDPNYPIPADPQLAAVGIYFITMNIVDTGGAGVATSQPLYLVYDNGLPEQQEDEAKTYIRNVYAPLTNLPGLSVAATTSPPSAAINFPSTWNLSGSGTWANPAAWNGPIPSGQTGDAVLGQTASIASTVTLAAPQAIGHLAFDNSNSYTLTGAMLTMGDGSATAEVTVNSGSHVISAPIYLASPTTFTVVPLASVLTISSPITSASGVGMAKEGPGMVVAPKITTGSLDVVEGTLQLKPTASTGPSQFGALTVETGATLDLTNASAIVSYSGTSPIASIAASVAAAYDQGRWDLPGITSSTAAANPLTAIGILDNASAGLTKFENVAISSSSILLRYTWYGDANLDGVVNQDDYALLDRGDAKHLNGWVNGDFNYDGVVDQNDYLLIDRSYAVSNGGVLSADFLAGREAQFGAAYVSELIASVPEPGTLAWCLAAICITRRRRTAERARLA